MTGPAGTPSRPVGRADATGPLPVTAPADVTGPMPAPVATPDQQAIAPADPTGPQPITDAVTDSGGAPDGTPGTTTGPMAAPSSWFDAGDDPADTATSDHADPTPEPATETPASLDDAAVEQPPPVVVAAPEAPVADAPPPRTTLFEAVTPAADAGAPPATHLFEAVAPPRADAGSPPAASLFEPVTPPQTGNGAPPTTNLFEAATPPPDDAGTAPATSFFESVTPTATGHATTPPASLFEPTRTDDAGGAPATGLFAAVDPAAAAGTGAGVGGQTAARVPIDVTGPLLAVGAPPAPVHSGSRPGHPGTSQDTPPTTALPLVGGDAAGALPSGRTASPAADPGDDTALVPTPPAEQPGRTDAWSFGPGSGAHPRPGASPADTAGEPPARATPASVLAVPSPPSDRRRRSTWLLTALGVLAAIVTGIALVFWIARTDPDELVAAAAADLGSWDAVHYQGSMAALDGGEIQFDVVVAPEGASGTLIRDSGRATADVLRDQSGTLLRANHNWWLYHHGSRADDLADTWVAEPLTETQEIDPVLALHPAALAQLISPEEQSTGAWEAVEQQVVEGQPAILLSDGSRRLIVAADEPHRLLAVDIGATTDYGPVRVTDVPSDEAEAAAGQPAGVRSAEAPRTLAQRLRERPQVEIQLEPEPLCVTETCGVTVTVTNSGAGPARGHLEISADGQIVANHPLEVHPGQVVTFTATAPNPHFADPGATGEILWESRAVDD